MEDISRNVERSQAVPSSANHLSSELRREPPRTAYRQREEIVRLLREAAHRGQGVSGDVLRHDHLIPQAPARIWELKNHFGYEIETKQGAVTRMATYFLVADPPENWQPPAKQRKRSEELSRHGPSRFEQAHRLDVQREAPLFAGVAQ